MSFEKPVSTKENKFDSALWQNRIAKEQSIIGRQITAGELTPEQARRIQRERTKDIDGPNFDVGWALDYYHKTGGLVYHNGKLNTGESVDSIFERKAEYVQFDKIKESQK